MRKIIVSVTFILGAIVSYAAGGLGIITDEDLRQVGVTQENIVNAKKMVEQVSVNYKMLLLERKQLELQVNKYVLEGAEENLEKIDKNFERIGLIETQILKDRVRNQIEMQKYITQEQYKEARENAVIRIQREQELRARKMAQEARELQEKNNNNQ